MRERKLQEEEEQWLGPVVVAQFVELGWIRFAPMTITRRGLGAVRIGYGPKDPPSFAHQLSGEIVEHGDALFWDGRLVEKPQSLNRNGATR